VDELWHAWLMSDAHMCTPVGQLPPMSRVAALLSNSNEDMATVLHCSAP